MDAGYTGQDGEEKADADDDASSATTKHHLKFYQSRKSKHMLKLKKSSSMSANSDKADSELATERSSVVDLDFRKRLAGVDDQPLADRASSLEHIFAAQPLLPLRETVRLLSMHRKIAMAETHTLMAFQQADHLMKSGDDQIGELSRNQIASICLFCQGWIDYQGSVYHQLNAIMRGTLGSPSMREGWLATSAFLPYAALLISALESLRPSSVSQWSIVYCASEDDSLGEKYDEDAVTWQGITSCTIDRAMLSSRAKTIFKIECVSAIDISAFSSSGNAEVLLMPGISFEVKERNFENGEIVLREKPMRDKSRSNMSGSSISGNGKSADNIFSKKWSDRVRSWEVPYTEIQFGKPVGEGGQASVVEAWCYGMRCAAKRWIASTDRQYDEAVALLRREIKSLSQLHHPNIVRLLYACTQRNHLCVLMELADRGSLDQVVEDNPDLSDARCFALLQGVVSGMKVLHAHKPFPILHNDLKPANVLVDKDWVSKVADFGSATGAGTTATMNKTRGGPGTLRYQPPEVLNGRKDSQPVISTSSDVYSFAITVFETVTKTKAWPKKMNNDIMAAVLRKDRPTIPEICHPFFRELMESCWAQEQRKRPSFEAIDKMFEVAVGKYAELRSLRDVSTLHVVISTSERSIDGEEVMQMVEALCKTRSDMNFGYDWAGSTSKDERDKGVDWKDPSAVKDSFWFKGYKERVKGLVTGLVQQGHALQLVCIEGGPISQLEADSMSQIQDEVLQDLAKKGVADASISSCALSWRDFKRKFISNASS
jgi:serine/threonine protein kinase